MENNKDIKFFDKNLILEDAYSENINKFNIAIHIHLYYIDMLNMFISYIKDCPVNFDLLISVSSEENKNICLKEINNNSIPKLDKLKIKVVKNKGRDIGPFLIDFKYELLQYDIACHVHSKKSLHSEGIDHWVKYLFNNLISEEAIKNIISNFATNEKLGLVFPPLFHEVYKCAINLHETNKENIISLLKKINIEYQPNNSNFIFSAGNMFWYRTKALKKIFDLEITYDDIPDEPIPIDHTILHAIERIHCIIAENSGYVIKSYISRKELINIFYEKFETIKELESLKNEVKYLKDKEIEEIKDTNDKKSEIICIKLFQFIFFGIKKDIKYFTITIFGIRLIFKLK